MSDAKARWARAQLALTLLAIDPTGLRGLTVRARSGAVRDSFMAALPDMPLPMVRLHNALADETLYGGTDIAATLSTGQLRQSHGVLHRPVTAVLTAAERWSDAQAARLIQHGEAHPGSALILLDEGATPDETPPTNLTERLAFAVDLEGIGRLDATPFTLTDITPAKTNLAQITLPDDAIPSLVGLAARIGVASLLAPSLALRAAKAHAALSGHRQVQRDDLQIAAELVLAPRATCLPAPEDRPEDTPDETQDGAEGDTNTDTNTAPPPPSDPDQGMDAADAHPGVDLPDEVLINAIAAALPAGLMERLTTSLPARKPRGSGAGAKQKGNRRGRPLPSRPGSLSSGARVDLMASLRAAAPWQRLRGRGTGPVRVLRSDIRVRRYESRSDRLLVFAVDASGSAALARLGEAKGAVEYLLAEAYSRRDHVALIAFRGQQAELLLPPTRSLVQAKRKLSALPGGGGTPLAAGMLAAGQAADQAHGQGFSPVLAVLTDGRANIALDGTANRQAAQDDADRIALWLRQSGYPGLIIDAGLRPERRLHQLATTMGAQYLPMPRADAERLSRSLTDALDA